MSRHTYQKKGYDVTNSSEFRTDIAISYIGLVVEIVTILSYFFFDNWLLGLLIISLFIISLQIAFLRHLSNEAFKHERALTNTEFSHMYEEIEHIKEKLSNKSIATDS